MKIVYFGTPEFAVHPLKSIAQNFNVAAVVTQPDRPVGRGNKIQFGPVKVAALELGIPVYQPPTLKKSASEEFRNSLFSLKADLYVVAAYGLMLPKGILYSPRYGSVNIHGSLLPKYRGASPIHAAILNGDKETGITIIQMDEGLDTGDILYKESITINENESFSQLHDRLSVLGSKCILEAIKKAGATGEKQDNNLATHTVQIRKTDGLIDWNQPADKIINMIRAYELWPGVYTQHESNIIKIRGLKKLHKDENMTPGTLVSADPKDGLFIKTGDYVCEITELQLQGKKRLKSSEFLRGFKFNSNLMR